MQQDRAKIQTSGRKAEGLYSPATPLAGREEPRLFLTEEELRHSLVWVATKPYRSQAGLENVVLHILHYQQGGLICSPAYSYSLIITIKKVLRHSSPLQPITFLPLLNLLLIYSHISKMKISHLSFQMVWS